VVAYSPLARGRVADDEQFVRIGRNYGKTAAQVALRWIVRQAGVAAIPKGATEAHLRDNIDIFDFELDGEDIAEIEGLKRNQRLVDPDWAPKWDT
jgi:2,5-diketo-D-gluconate reductase B